MTSVTHTHFSKHNVDKTKVCEQLMKGVYIVWLDHIYLGKTIYCAVKANLKTWEPSTAKNLFSRNLSDTRRRPLTSQTNKVCKTSGDINILMKSKITFLRKTVRKLWTELFKGWSGWVSYHDKSCYMYISSYSLIVWTKSALYNPALVNRKF